MHGRALHVQCLNAVWDWGAFLHGLDIGNYSSLVSTHLHLDVETCHSKRFVQRRDLPLMNSPGWDIQIPNHFQTLVESPEDIIMCVKHFWSSSCLAQPPLLVLPTVLMQHVGPGPTWVVPRNDLSNDQCRGFLKTANQIEGPPWKLTRAAEYLRTWVEQNQDHSWPESPAMKWVVAPASELSQLQSTKPMPGVLSDYAPKDPRHINICPPQQN